jgi:hypothetical protein
MLLVQAKSDLEHEKGYNYKSNQSVIMFLILALVFRVYYWCLFLFCSFDKRKTGRHILERIW